MLVPDLDSPVIARCRLESAFWSTYDITLLLTRHSTRVKARLLSYLNIGIGRDAELVVCLSCIFLCKGEFPEHAKFIHVDANGFSKAVNATSKDLHHEQAYPRVDTC
jgi:hypothetical protein